MVIPANTWTFFIFKHICIQLFYWRRNFQLNQSFIKVLELYLFWFISLLIFNRKGHKVSTSFISSVTLITIINIVISATYKQIIIIIEPQNDNLSWLHLANYTIEGVISALAITLLALIVHVMKRQQEILVENVNLEKITVKAQLHALQTQVNPHFLFNNLNTLQSMIADDNVNAQNYLKNLADLFREMLNNRDVELVTIEQELEFSRLFIELLKGRFKNNLQVNFDLQDIGDNFPENIQYYVPPFTLQILLENIIKHNRLDQDHVLTCKVTQINDSLIIENNCHLKQYQVISNAIGLSNLKRRYQLLADKEIQIETGTVFKVTIPLLTVKQYA